jgi:nucleoside-diphosphate-sugar epimerase
MKVLITGGGGFLGAWLIKRLKKRNVDVRVFDLMEDRSIVREIIGDGADEIDWVSGDIADTEAVREAARGCTFAVHLAALLTPECSADPVLGAKVNLVGTLNVFEAAKAEGMTGVVYASSASALAPDSCTDLSPITHYGAYKLAAEGCARAYWIESGIPSIGFRPAIVYGPGRVTGLTAGPSVACREALAGRPYTIGYSGGADLIFVDDVAAVCEAAATRPFEGAHAVTLSGEMVDAGAIVEEIRKHVPEAELDWNGPTLPIPAEMVPTPVEDLLGALPRTPLSAGIARTIAHYRSGREA